MEYPPTPKAQLDARYESQRQRTDLHLSTQDTCFDPNNFHHKFRLFGYEKLREFLNSLRETLDNKSVVVLGCGKGFDFHLIKYFFRNVDLAGVDISETALELVKKSFPNVRAFLGNMESLGFEDGAFDYAIVPVALHHLQSVYRGVYEAIRISRKGALLMEPYDSPLARLATRLGYATEYEEVGNYVFRTSIREMKKVGKAIFMDVQAKPYMYVHYTAKTSLDYNIWRGLNALADLAAPWVANECIVYFRKEYKIGPKNHS